MRCRQCGNPLSDDEGICAWCGATQVLTQPDQPAAQGRPGQPSPGAPAAAYAPSLHGPPVAGDIVALPAGQYAPPSPMDTPATMRRLGYHPVVLPSHPTRGAARRVEFSRSAIAALALFAVLGLAAGVVARGGDVPIPGLAAMRARPTATATAVPACLAAPLTHTTAPTLASLQLTTGLKSLKQHDYRPVNDVTHFTVGSSGYITFRVLSPLAGTADVVVCTPGHRFTGFLPVPKGSAGQYVEFALAFGADDVGQGMVTISWNGSAAGNQAFTVSR